MKELWENLENAVGTIKDIVFGFYDMVTFIFGLIPEPFSQILGIALIVIVALVAAKIVRG